MKFLKTLFIASALSLTACGTTSNLHVPASTPVSLPSSPDKRPVEPVAPLPSKDMGGLATGYGNLLKQYGTLGVRFNTFREFYDCVVEQVNNHKSPKSCL